MYRMNGMPINAMALPAGNGAAATWDTRSADVPRMAPVMRLTGRTVRCADVPARRLAMWGATIPTNPTGPQKAVAAPVTRQHPAREIHLIFCGSAPERAA